MIRWIDLYVDCLFDDNDDDDDRDDDSDDGSDNDNDEDGDGWGFNEDDDESVNECASDQSWHINDTPLTEVSLILMNQSKLSSFSILHEKKKKTNKQMNERTKQP